MKSARISLPKVYLFENPRSVDRLNAVCSVLLGICLLVMLVLAMQPNLNPKALTVESLPSSTAVQSAAAPGGGSDQG